MSDKRMGNNIFALLAVDELPDEPAAPQKKAADKKATAPKAAPPKAAPAPKPAPVPVESLLFTSLVSTFTSTI